ncbi:MAG: ATP-binding protein [Gammaproteobacteria bacterium]
MRSDAANPDVQVAIASSDDVVVARQKGRALALEIGFTASEATLIAAAISELARNIVRYAGAGEMLLRDDGNGMLLMVARDRGPGIPDVKAALRVGFSTSGGLGMGLPGVRRIADVFEIVSNGAGTTVTVGKYKR